MKKMSLLLPAALFPYALILGTVFQFTELITATGLLCLLWIPADVAFVIWAGQDGGEAMVKATLILKCVHIPAYVIFFLISLVSPIFASVWFIPFILMIVLFDFIMLLSSSVVGICALSKALSEKNEKLRTPLVVALVFQVFFVLDVVGIVMAYICIKKFKREQKAAAPLVTEESAA